MLIYDRYCTLYVLSHLILTPELQGSYHFTNEETSALKMNVNNQKWNLI